MDIEKDLERGDSESSKIGGDEKSAGVEVEPAQSSPTLTQGTFESNCDAKGMQRILVFGLNRMTNNYLAAPIPKSSFPSWTTRVGKAFSWPRSNKSDAQSLDTPDAYRVRKCEDHSKFFD